MNYYHCILGSQSPRRKDLLSSMGIPFEVRVSEVEENFDEEMDVRLVAAYLAEKKALALIDSLNQNDILLTADSTVICEEKIYNKPFDEEDAFNMLQSLSGKTHEVITGVWIGNSEFRHSFSASTFVEFAELSDQEILYYIRRDKPFDKAGSYGIQDWLGTTKVKSIQGSYTNVMGLPTERVFEVLKKYFPIN